MGRHKALPKTKELDAVKRFQAAIDLKALRLFLEDSELPKYQILFGMMCDPAYSRYSFATLLKKAHVSVSEIQQIYTDGMRHIGLLQMMNQLPQIMADVAEDARTTEQPCPRCDGLGKVPFGEAGTRTCPVCEGDRTVRKIGDKHARDLVFQSAKLTGNTGPLVAIQNNFDMGDAKMESMLKRTRSIVLDNKPQQVLGSPPNEE